MRNSTTAQKKEVFGNIYLGKILKSHITDPYKAAYEVSPAASHYA